MATKTKIEWADYVTNPIKARNGEKTGYACIRHSEGCAHCWASTFNVRLGTGLPYTVQNMDADAMFLDEAEIGRILKLSRKGPFKNGRNRAVVFPCDMTDLFGHWVDHSWQERLFQAFAANPDLDWFVLTKRTEAMADFAQYFGVLQNVYLGTSVENGTRARERWAPMIKCSEMGWKTWISYEPALGLLPDLHSWRFLDWLVCGGESGHGARPMNPDWAREARDFCITWKIPYFFKQWGEWAPVDQLVWMTDKTTFSSKPVNVGGTMMARVGRGKTGHLLDGVEWRQMPSTDSLTDSRIGTEGDHE